MKNYTVELLEMNEDCYDGFEVVYSADGFKTVGECIEWVNALSRSENVFIYFTYYAILDGEEEILFEPYECLQLH